MKNIIILLLVGLVFLSAACDPIEKREELGAKLTVAQIQVTAENTTPGGNEVELRNSTPNVSGTWYFDGESSTDQVHTIVYPAVGTFTVKFVATTPGGIVEKDVEVTVTTIDHPIPPPLGYLVGENPSEGKTWVYATDYPGSDAYPAGNYCFMVADYNVEEFWWNPYDGGGAPADINSEMKFDLGNGSVHTFYQDASATGVQGTFSLDKASMTLTISDSQIPDYDEPNLNPAMTATGVYQILSVTENELILTQNQADWGYNWIWIFKAKGYNYPTK